VQAATTQPPEPVAVPAAGQQADRAEHAGFWAVATLAGALAPALAAIWAVPWFVPQDAPAHVYNAHILAWSFDPASPFRDFFLVKWQPIPNWAGPLTLAGLVAVLPAWVADRIMTSLTLACFAASVFWLRWRVAGTHGLRAAAFFATLLAMNMAWIYGFASFMLGACLFPITLGLWWPARHHLSTLRLIALAVLLTLGYFCHLVSLGLTIGGLFVLSVVTPVRNQGESGRWQRLSRIARTCTTFLPVVLLGLYYVSIATQRAPMRPQWENLGDLGSPRAWLARLKWVDPISLAIRDGIPGTERSGPAFVVFAPAVWLAVAIGFWCFGMIFGRLRAQKNDHTWCWLLLAILLLVAGVAGPDSLGQEHGNYLPQRVILLGLVALVPVFDIDTSRDWGRGCVAALVAAVALQSAVVWDYAFYSDRTVGQMIRARNTIGTGQRIAALLVSTRSRFRSNPLLHGVDWLGVDSGNIVWNDYETLHYYFPVQFRPGIDRPLPNDLERVSLQEDPATSAARARAWAKILDEHAGSIDVLVVWKNEPALDAITARWFDRVDRQGDVQIYRRRSSKPN
jgi:hypothetical protein